MQATAESDQRPGEEAAQIEVFIVQDPPAFRVSGEQHLEAAVQLMPVDHVGPDPSADAVGRLEYHDVAPGAV